MTSNQPNKPSLVLVSQGYARRLTKVGNSYMLGVPADIVSHLASDVDGDLWIGVTSQNGRITLHELSDDDIESLKRFIERGY